MIAYLGVWCLLSTAAAGQIDIDNIDVNYVCYQKDLPRVLEELAMQNQVNLAYSKADIPNKPISINAKNYSLRETLTQILEGTALNFETVDYSVVIFHESVYLNARFSLKGYITDEESGERLLYADVYQEDLSNGTSSNDYGFYILNLRRGQIKLICSYLGYYTKEITVDLKRDKNLDIKLLRKSQQVIDEVLITANRFESKAIDFFKPNNIDLEAIDRMVSLGGEDDLMRLLYSGAGVLTGADGFGGMHVRGGNADQNLILLDGVPVYNAQHAIGLYSIFNNDVIQSSRLMKGDVPARYGGSASSVLDIRTRNGDKNRTRGNFNLGLFTLKAALEGPLVPGKISYLVSGRRTYADLWIKSLREYLNRQQGSTGNTQYYNYDLNGKIHAVINPSNNIFLSFYSGRDRYDYGSFREDPVDGELGLFREENNENLTDWGNQLVALKWTSNPGNKIFMDHSIIYSGFKMDNFVMDWVGERMENQLDHYRFSERLFISSIRDIGFQSNLEYFKSPGQTIRFGLKSTRHLFNPGVLIFDSESFDKVDSFEELPGFTELKSDLEPIKSISWENRIYVENEKEFGSHTRLNLGIQLAHFYADDDMKFFLEPRMLLNTKISERSILSLSGTMMTQYLHLLNNNGLGFPSQVWLPSTIALKPQRSWQISLGLNNYHSGSLQSFIHAYYKSMNKLVMADAGEYLDISQGESWEAKLPVGLGYSYGIEAGLEWSSSVVQAHLNYGLLYSKRKFDELNGGLEFEHRYARRHNVNLNLNYKINKHINFSMNWTYGSGNPYTFPTQIASFIQDGQLTTNFVYESLNNHRLPDYHRLDFEFNFTSNFSWGRQQVTLGAYNMYNRKNPFYITFDNQGNNINDISSTSFNYVYVFPLVPVLNYSIEF